MKQNYFHSKMRISAFQFLCFSLCLYVFLVEKVSVYFDFQTALMSFFEIFNGLIFMDVGMNLVSVTVILFYNLGRAWVIKG